MGIFIDVLVYVFVCVFIYLFLLIMSSGLAIRPLPCPTARSVGPGDVVVGASVDECVDAWWATVGNRVRHV